MRSALVLLLVLAAALAALSWDTIRALPHRLEALPIGLVVLVALFGVYVWRKTREIAELRGLLRGIEQRIAVPPSDRQMEQLIALVTRSQQGYRDLIDTLDNVVLSLSLDGEICAMNRSFADLLDLPFAQIVGHPLDEFLDLPEGEGRAAAEKALPRFLERRQWAGIIRVRLRKNGAVRYLDCLLHAMVREGQVIGISALGRDITLQRESEARFTELFETLQEGVYFTTPEGQLLDANPALVRMLGYSSKGELQGANVQDLYHEPSQRGEVLSEVERQGTVHSREIALRRKDGSPLICLDTSTAIRDSLGHIVRYQGTLVDITQRREIERRLHAEQEFARRLVDSFPDLIVVLDTQRRFTFVSQRSEESLGYRPEELIGVTMGERTHPEDRQELVCLFNDLIAGCKPHGILEYRSRHKDGSWRLLRASASPLFDAGGKIAGVVASARDITEVERLEQQLIQAEKLAAMGQMIAGVAHELNNPLTAILGVSELMRERSTDSETRRQLDLTLQQARRAAYIVQSLLTFARPNVRGKVRLQLAELLQRTLQLHEHSLRANNITVGFAAEPGLPLIYGDPSQLTQVFLNLIMNAEQAIHEIRDHGTLRVRVRRAGNAISLAFQDDGPGIQRDVLPRIFDPFFTTKRPGRGTGLGLSICMALVKEHGGDIEAQTSAEGGALFTVTLPVERASGSPEATPGAELTGGRELAGQSASRGLLDALQGHSVLIVDDEESIRELVQEGLTARGMRVDAAASGEQALRLASARDYDAVLCDLHLGPAGANQMCGKGIFEVLSEHAGEHLPVFFFMTGDLVPLLTLDEMVQSGAHVLQKPFQISELAAQLAEPIGATARQKTTQ